MNICNRWVRTVGGSLPAFAPRAGPPAVTEPCFSFGIKMLAAATASWIARFTPTPPIGDMAWAASPMNNSPGRLHSARRSTATVSNLTSSQDFSSSTRSAEVRHQRSDRGTKCRQAGGLRRRNAAFWDDIGTLPIVAAIQRDHHAACHDASERFRSESRLAARQAQPKHIDRRTEFRDLEPGGVADGGMAAIRRDHQVRLDCCCRRCQACAPSLRHRRSGRSLRPASSGGTMDSFAPSPR